MCLRPLLDVVVINVIIFIIVMLLLLSRCRDLHNEGIENGKEEVRRAEEGENESAGIPARYGWV